MRKIAALFFFDLFILFLLPAYDPDLGWHLRCGEEFWQGRGFCQINHFSVLLENYFWPNHHWLYQAIIFPIYKFTGFWGLSFANAILMTMAFGFFWKAIGKEWFLEKILAIILVVFFSWGVFSLGIRSQLVGFFFFNMLLWVFSRSQYQIANSKYQKYILKIKNFWILDFIMLAIRQGFWVFLVMFLWANLHGGSVILGLILLAYFFFLKLVGRSPKREIIFLFVICNLSFVISFLNPSGAGIYAEAWRHVGGLDLSKLIAEWVAPEPAVLWPLGIAGIIIAGFIFYYETGRKKLNLILLLPFAFLIFKARRNVPFFAETIVFLFLSSPALGERLLPYLSFSFLRRFLAGGLVGLIFIYAVFFHLPIVIFANSSFIDYCEETSLSYPCRAVEFLKNRSASGNIFNRYEWGGFLIWQLPSQKIFVDGRMPAWSVADKDALLDKGGLTVSGKSPYTIYLETLQNQPGWEKTLENYKIDWILISPGTFMDLLLRPEPRLAGPEPEKYGWGIKSSEATPLPRSPALAGFTGWKEIYRDGGAVMYERQK